MSTNKLQIVRTVTQARIEALEAELHHLNRLLDTLKEDSTSQVSQNQPNASPGAFCEPTEA